MAKLANKGKKCGFGKIFPLFFLLFGCLPTILPPKQIISKHFTNSEIVALNNEIPTFTMVWGTYLWLILVEYFPLVSHKINPQNNNEFGSKFIIPWFWYLAIISNRLLVTTITERKIIAFQKKCIE